MLFNVEKFSHLLFSFILQSEEFISIVVWMQCIETNMQRWNIESSNCKVNDAKCSYTGNMVVRLLACHCGMLYVRQS